MVEESSISGPRLGLPKSDKRNSLLALSEHIETDCTLMFSGGRDSTLAAARLNDRQWRLTLVTVTSNHLTGIEQVHRRLRELATVLPGDTPWVHVEQPEDLRTDTSFYDRTCLPCHHAYVVIAATIARIMRSPNLAFGYVGYQNDWPEQTPLAVSRLADVLDAHKIKLLLPVYDILSREEAVKELAARSLDTQSLEQKCLRQVQNVSLDAQRLNQQVDLWEKAINNSMKATPPIDVNAFSICFLKEF